jgi:protein TonB
LFHASLVVIAASLLVRAAHEDVAQGKTSIELALIPAPPTPAAVPPPAPKPPVPPPPAPVAQPVLPPKPARKISEIIPASSAPAIKARPAAPVARLAFRPAPTASPVAPGATEAQPDDLDNQPPVYPEDSRAAREQGMVMLRVDVSAAGRADRVAIVKSSGYFRLDQAARDTVRDWRFHPALRAGNAVSSEVDVPVRFELQ